MNGRHVEDRLSTYLDGELEGAGRAEVEAHLAVCPDCAFLLEAMRDARGALAALPEIDPSPALLSRLYAIPDTRKRRGFRPVLDLLLRPALQPVLAGATGLLVFLSFLAFSPEGRTLQKGINRQLHAGYGRIERLYVKAGAIPQRIGADRQAFLDSLGTVDILRKDADR